jgi:hypothetical protein
MQNDRSGQSLGKVPRPTSPAFQLGDGVQGQGLAAELRDDETQTRIERNSFAAKDCVAKVGTIPENCCEGVPAAVTIGKGVESKHNEL